MHRGFAPLPYQPHRWVRNPHAQTVGGKFLRPAPRHRFRRERWETPDGDFLDLDFGEALEGHGGADPNAADTSPSHLFPNPGGTPERRIQQEGASRERILPGQSVEHPERPIILLLHGLEGSTRRAYMRLAMDEVIARGMTAIGLNFRSCSGEPNRALTFYHSGETDDLRWVLGELLRRFPNHPLGAMGFSLGGNVLLKYLAEEARNGGPGNLGLDHTPSASPLGAAVAISVPFDLAAGTHRLETSRMGKIYTHYFLRSLLRKVQAKGERLAPVLDLTHLEGARSLREFDDRFTAPLHGFDDAWDYYARSSSGPLLEEIRTPTLVLHGMDDPFLPPEAVPMVSLADNPWILPAIATTGGHVGFMQHRRLDPAPFWAEAEGARYLSHLLAPSG